MHRCVSVVGAVCLGILSSGCILWNSAIHYQAAPTPQPSSTCDGASQPPPEQEMLGVALSGGGSRAAVFGAATLEALWEQGLLGAVTHLSSVSGGSIAASYFVANHPACDALPAEAERDRCWREFFADFKKAMRVDYFQGMTLQQVRKFRWFSNTRRSTSLADVLDRRFLGGLTFAELRARTAASDARIPNLLVNAASYDEGRRFVFSNLCMEEPPEPPSGRPLSTDDPISQRRLRAITFARPGCAQPTPGEIRVSLAVATSAAVPFLMGPVTLNMPDTCEGGEPQYWHLGDGGIIDNKGTETLEEVVLRERLRGKGKLRRVLLLSMDSGKQEDSATLKQIEDFWPSYHPTRVIDLAAESGKGYHDLVWRKLRPELASEGIWFDSMAMRYTDADLSVWPASCRSEARKPAGRPVGEAIREQLAQVPTDLEISPCNADLMEQSARAIVHATLDDATRERLRRAGFPVQAAKH